MPNRVTVWVIDYNRKFLVLQWIDPTTGKRRSQSSKCTGIRAARDAARELSDHLTNVAPRGDGSISWDDFTDLYEKEHLASLADSSCDRANNVLSVFGRTMSPVNLNAITGSVLSKYCEQLRKDRSETTITTHVTHLKAALRWARDNGYIAELPRFPRSAKGNKSRPKGRPLTWSEFSKLLQSVRLVDDLKRLDREGRRMWRRLLVGLWLSGLRLDEALSLTWESEGSHESDLWVTTTGKYPLLGIASESEKGKKDRLLPIVPDFGIWLLKVPESKRNGFVFPLPKVRRASIRPKDIRQNERLPLARRMDSTSKVITAIGKSSGVTVNAAGKFASAHDLRRSFGLRWSGKLMPSELQQLMRHESVETTMKYYVRLEAESFAERLWKENTTTDTTQIQEGE